MRVEFIDLFVGAAVTVLKDVLGEPVEAGRVSLEMALSTKECFSVSFGLTGDVSGTVLFGVPEKTAMDIASIMNETEFASINEPIVLDSLAELMNMVAGRCVTLLNDRGFNFSLTPPAIFWSRELRICSTDVETLIVPISTDCGDLSVSVAIRVGV